MKLMGTSFSQRTASGAPVFVTPMKHLSYPAKLELQQAAGHAICRSIEKIMAALAA
ncbi:MAG: hypothetical protein HWD60_20510 [Defluviicoccus sp.]|nr:MAG: hypothetical protein HWD60_00055 [Defluviicoccus sp.]QLH40834.1 MAG: hypothetical protein HWD60_20510 [Defluviicoccus sp.]